MSAKVPGSLIIVAPDGIKFTGSGIPFGDVLTNPAAFDPAGSAAAAQAAAIAAVKPSSLVQGTATNDDAPAGFLGEYVQARQDPATGPSVAGGGWVTVLTLNLTAGDWDVSGSVAIQFGGASVDGIIAGISDTTNQEPADDLDEFRFNPGLVASGDLDKFTVPTVRASLAAPASRFLVVNAAITVGTATAGGKMMARRVR